MIEYTSEQWLQFLTKMDQLTGAVQGHWDIASEKQKKLSCL